MGKSKLAQSLWYCFPVSTLQGAATDSKHQRKRLSPSTRCSLGFFPFSMKSSAVLLPQVHPPRVGAGRSARIAVELLRKRETNTEKQTQRVLYCSQHGSSQWCFRIVTNFYLHTVKKWTYKNLKIKILSPQVSLPSFPPSPKKHLLLQTVFSFLRVQKLECRGNTNKREGISSCTLHYKEVCSQT